MKTRSCTRSPKVKQQVISWNLRGNWY